MEQNDNSSPGPEKKVDKVAKPVDKSVGKPTKKPAAKSKSKVDKKTYKMPKFPESYEIPDSILKQLQEHSLGYMLIALDNQGQLKLYERFDNSITAEAVRFKFGKILAAQEEISNTILFNAMVPDELRDNGNGDDE
jgi:hypothetical protein